MWNVQRHDIMYGTSRGYLVLLVKKPVKGHVGVDWQCYTCTTVIYLHQWWRHGLQHIYKPPVLPCNSSCSTKCFKIFLIGTKTINWSHHKNRVVFPNLLHLISYILRGACMLYCNTLYSSKIFPMHYLRPFDKCCLQSSNTMPGFSTHYFYPPSFQMGLDLSWSTADKSTNNCMCLLQFLRGMALIRAILHLKKPYILRIAQSRFSKILCSEEQVS